MAGAVLVVRPQPGADETVEALRQSGFTARALPVLDRRALPETPALRAVIQDLAAYLAVIFVSPAAVELGMQWIDRYWPQYPARTRWVAVGARTRSALAAWDVPAMAPPEDDERSEGLLALPALTDVAGERVLIMRGREGRELLAGALTDRGARVDVLDLYERVPLQVALPEAQRVDAVVASSVAVLEAFLASGGERFAERPLVVPSARVAAAAKAAGFSRVMEAVGAGPAAAVAALELLRGSGGEVP